MSAALIENRSHLHPGSHQLMHHDVEHEEAISGSSPRPMEVRSRDVPNTSYMSVAPAKSCTTAPTDVKVGLVRHPRDGRVRKPDSPCVMNA